MSQPGDGARHEDEWGSEEPTPWQQDRVRGPAQEPSSSPGRPDPGPPGPHPGPHPGSHPGPHPGTPPNYLVHSILATLLCCLPTGVVGIVYAAQVNGKLAAGDLVGAAAASQKARLWTIISVVAGLTAGTLYVLVYSASL